MSMRIGFLAIPCLVVLCACKGEGADPAAGPEPRGPEPVVASAPARAGSVAGAAPAAAGEAASPLARVPSNCPEGRTVDAGGNTTPEGVLWDAYSLALQPDGDAGAAEFHRLFVEGTPVSHVRRTLWPRVREHVAKYVADPGKVSYVVCRKVEQPDGRVKIFVKCNDPRKSDPPTVLVRESGAWKIDVMTP